MELPEEKGTYILIANVSQVRRLQVGSLGRFDVIPGFYAYVGSAFGAGGLRARLGHHLASAAEPHWHIDYLLQVACPVEVWFATAGRKLETSLGRIPGSGAVLPRSHSEVWFVRLSPQPAEPPLLLQAPALIPVVPTADDGRVRVNASLFRPAG